VPARTSSYVIWVAIPDWELVHGGVPSSHAENGVRKEALVQRDARPLGDSSEILDSRDSGQLTTRGIEASLIVQGAEVCPEEHESLRRTLEAVEETASPGEEAWQVEMWLEVSREEIVRRVTRKR